MPMAPRTASIRFFEVIALASAPGYGLAWAELNPDAEHPAADLKLGPIDYQTPKTKKTLTLPALQPGTTVHHTIVWNRH